MRAELGFVLIIVGFTLFFIAALLPLTFTGNASVSGGGCIIIFFFPVCFGLGDQPVLMMVLSMVLAIALLTASYLFLRSMRGGVEFHEAS